MSGGGGPSDGFERPSAEAPELTTGDTIQGSPAWTREDWEILEATARWAWDEGVDRRPMGERVAEIGRRFVGTAYVPRTLDPPGPERLVVNLRAFDCVTYVESMIVLAHFVRETSSERLAEDPKGARDLYESLLTTVRYRNGRMEGYPSRLHYFSEWIADGEAKGWITDVGESIGGVADPAPIDFMTSHADAYSQLEDPEVLSEIAASEARLSERLRYYLPEGRVAGAEAGIRTGDVIAATSTFEGLDIAHTGIALWLDGVLHLMHAPLVGEAVQISEAPLAERLLGISSQDGIMVGRPMELRADVTVR